jgi:transcriptional regulator with XRE-family HTH domain
MEKLAKRLREERNRKGWSYKTLGEKAGVSWRTIYLVEAEQVSPSVKTLTKIAGALELGPAYFLS